MQFQIARVAGGLDRRSFERTYYRSRVPVVIEDVAPHWTALRAWDIDHLARHLENTEVFVGLSDTCIFKEDKAERRDFRTFAERMRSDVRPGAKGVANMPLGRMGELAHALLPAPAVLPVERPDVQVWVSPQSAVTVLHYDYSDGLIVQVRGRKRWSLYDPLDWRSLYPRPILDRYSYHSRVDIDSPDLAEFPAFNAARRFEATIEAGQAIFVPAPWWHQVYSLDDCNISVHYRWFNRSAGVAIKPPMVRLRVQQTYYRHRSRMRGWLRGQAM